jgi:hypothetical protein
MKRVYSSFNLQLVHHKQNLLASEGVDSEIRNIFLGSAMGELPPTEIELWVDDRDLTKAEAIFNRIPSGPAWQCTCGETLGPQFTHCWNCQAPRTPAPR